MDPEGQLAFHTHLCHHLHRDHGRRRLRHRPCTSLRSSIVSLPPPRRPSLVRAAVWSIPCSPLLLLRATHFGHFPALSFHSLLQSQRYRSSRSHSGDRSLPFALSLRPSSGQDSPRGRTFDLSGHRPSSLCRIIDRIPRKPRPGPHSSRCYRHRHGRYPQYHSGYHVLQHPMEPWPPITLAPPPIIQPSQKPNVVFQ